MNSHRIHLWDHHRVEREHVTSLQETQQREYIQEGGHTGPVLEIQASSHRHEENEGETPARKLYWSQKWEQPVNHRDKTLDVLASDLLRSQRHPRPLLPAAQMPSPILCSPVSPHTKVPSSLSGLASLPLPVASAAIARGEDRISASHNAMEPTAAVSAPRSTVRYPLPHPLSHSTGFPPYQSGKSAFQTLSLPSPGTSIAADTIKPSSIFPSASNAGYLSAHGLDPISDHTRNSSSQGVHVPECPVSSSFGVDVIPSHQGNQVSAYRTTSPIVHPVSSPTHDTQLPVVPTSPDLIHPSFDVLPKGSSSAPAETGSQQRPLRYDIAKLHSYGYTIIAGKVYNDKGHGICGVLNQHNRPCRRIGKCPFHYHLFPAPVSAFNSCNGIVDADGNAPISAATSASQHNWELGPSCHTLPEGGHTDRLRERMSSRTSASPTNLHKLHGISRNRLSLQPPKKEQYKHGWRKEEHCKFLIGLEIFKSGSWKQIADFVKSRSATQVQSHAQKYFQRKQQKTKRKSSIHDLHLDSPDMEDVFKKLRESFPMLLEDLLLVMRKTGAGGIHNGFLYGGPNNDYAAILRQILTNPSSHEITEDMGNGQVMYPQVVGHVLRQSPGVAKASEQIRSHGTYGQGSDHSPDNGRHQDRSAIPMVSTHHGPNIIVDGLHSGVHFNDRDEQYVGDGFHEASTGPSLHVQFDSGHGHMYNVTRS